MEETLSLSTSELDSKDAILQAIAGLSRQGRLIFPAGPDKKPLIKEWPEKATAIQMAEKKV